MAIQRWDPQRDLVRLQENVNRMFEEVLGRSTSIGGVDRAHPGDWRPPVDLFEEVERFVLRVDLPGVASSEVEIRIDQDNLIVEGERRSDPEAYLRLERPVGRFSAQVALPPTVDRDRIHAHHRNGVLEIVLPKQKEEPPSRVEVGSS